MLLNKVALRLFDTGYCSNFEKMAAAEKPFVLTRFYAMVGLIEHPKQGPILFDTGYSSHLINLCRKFPYCCYSWFAPIKSDPKLNAAMQLERFGYRPADIKTVILSHFHPDHIGGVCDFPNAQYYASQNAFSHFRKYSWSSGIKHLFFPRLLPQDFETRLISHAANPIKIPFKPFSEGYDLFGDQSIIAVDLPGHALGQFGVFLKTSSQTVFLCADACWQSSNYLNLEYPLSITKAAIQDYTAFCETLKKLNELKHNHPEIEVIPTHCLEMWEKYVKGGMAC